MEHWNCPECHRKISVKIKNCPYCRPAPEPAPAPAPPVSKQIPLKTPPVFDANEFIEVDTKYPAMSFISAAIKVFAGLLFVIGLFVVFFSGKGMIQNGAGFVLFTAVLTVLWSYSEAIDIAVDIEANQRKMIKISTKSQYADFEGARTCPHCAETIKPAAKICRYCQKEVTPL